MSPDAGERLVRPRLVDAAELGPRAEAGTTGLEVWLTGTGTPTVHPDRTGPSTLLRAGEDLLLVDCGNGCAYQIARLGMDPRDLGWVFLTHHHIDHNADLGFLLLSAWAQLRKRPWAPPTIVGPPGTFDFVDRTLAAQEYDMRVRIPQGGDPGELAAAVVEVEDGTVVHGTGWRATAFRVEHDPVDQAFGYRFDAGGLSAVVSGDTRPCENLIAHAHGADLLVHEVLYPGHGFPTYHTLASDVGVVAARAEVRHLALTHLIPGDLPDGDWLEQVLPHFRGSVTVGRDLAKVLDGPDGRPRGAHSHDRA
jgi:ribonuclease Z